MKTIVIDPLLFDGDSFALEYGIQDDAFWVENGNTLVFPDTLPDVPNVIGTLASQKTQRNLAIDARTRELISVGFTFDGDTFSLSLPAQLNREKIKGNKADYTFPLNITTLDDNTYSLTSANVESIWVTAKNFLDGHLDSGRVLKKSIYDAADKAAVDAVVDNR